MHSWRRDQYTICVFCWVARTTTTKVYWEWHNRHLIVRRQFGIFAECWACFSLAFFPGPLWPGEVKPARVISLKQINMFKNYLYSILRLYLAFPCVTFSQIWRDWYMNLPNSSERAVCETRSIFKSINILIGKLPLSFSSEVLYNKKN